MVRGFVLCTGINRRSRQRGYVVLLLFVTCRLLVLTVQSAQAFVLTIKVPPNPTATNRAAVRDSSRGESPSVRDDYYHYGDEPLGIKIEPIEFKGLPAVAHLLVAAFNAIEPKKKNWIPALTIAQNIQELDRLQRTFHSRGLGSDRHLMLVATCEEDGSLAGFVDIDARARKKQKGQSKLQISGLTEKCIHFRNTFLSYFVST